MTKTLGVAVVGLGVGEQHAITFAADPGCEVRWLIDHNDAKARAVKARLGCGQIGASLAAALADPDVQIVSIASFDHMHAAEVLACLKSGRHVFVEKPLCRTLDELSEIIAAWQASGRPHLASNLVLREAPLYRWLGAQIAAGAFGTIYAIDGDYLYGRVHKITAGWRGDVENYSVIEGGGIHLIDLMAMICGEKPDSVVCQGNRIATADSAFRYDDYMAATFAFPSGLIGRLTANFGCVHKHHHVLRVFGTKASFIYDDQGARVHRSRDEDAQAEILAFNPLPASKGVLIPAFIDAVRSDADPAAAAQREFDLIRMVAATERAHAQSTFERIGYDT